MNTRHTREEAAGGDEESARVTKVEAVIARVLQVPEAQITDELEYMSLMEWDSLAHVNLMLALEKEYGMVIDPDLIVELRSVAVIRSYVQQHTAHQGDREPMGKKTPAAEETPEKVAPKKQVYRGLTGVVFDRTRITRIDGRTGKLLYRGYSVHDLVEHSTFEETAYLLLRGVLPTREELDDFSDTLKTARFVPAPVLDIIRTVQDAHPIEVVRTAVSALAAFDGERDDHSEEAFRQRGVRLIAQLPILVATHHVLRAGRQPVQPSPTLSHAANFLYILHGTIPPSRTVQIMDKILILHADHGSNASTFTARVVAGTRSDLYAALTAAIAAFAGPLHGGAIEHVVTMVQAIGEPDRAAEYVARLRANNAPVMGFGHRVYQTEDPRARHLRQVARELSTELGDPRWYNILEAVVDAMRPYVEKGVDVNVDFYASVIYHLLGIPPDLFVPAFVVGRMPGWIAQVREQVENNILIRPLLEYVGAEDLPYLPLEQRSRSGLERFA